MTVCKPMYSMDKKNQEIYAFLLFVSVVCYADFYLLHGIKNHILIGCIDWYIQSKSMLVNVSISSLLWYKGFSTFLFYTWLLHSWNRKNFLLFFIRFSLQSTFVMLRYQVTNSLTILEGMVHGTKSGLQSSNSFIHVQQTFKNVHFIWI